MGSSQTSSGVEYRIRWRREGQQHAYRIYQTRQAAERKVRGILALEEVKSDTRMEDMPALVEPPVILCRAVGEWEVLDVTIEPTDKDRDGMRDYFAEYDDYAGIL